MCGGTRERGELKPGQWVSRKRAQERSLEYAPTKGLGGAHERDPQRTGLQGRGGRRCRDLGQKCKKVRRMSSGLGPRILLDCCFKNNIVC